MAKNGSSSSNKRDSSSSRNSGPNKKLKGNGSDAGGGGDGGGVRIVDRTTPEKSPNDPNDYRVVKLSTGLTVALISRRDPPGRRANSSHNTSYHSFGNVWSFPNKSGPQCHFIDPEACPSYQMPELECAPATPDIDPKTIFGPSTILQRACAAQQPETSVAVVVSAGGMHDPAEWQGLAHFTEHMVHYGSKKFPSEEAVDVVVANFGTFNATTRQETTNYYNEVPDAILEKNLELFADMLAQPLFSVDVLNREVNAVDNEFYLRLPVWRKLLLQIHVGIKGNTHPLQNFLCGSLATLGEGKNGAKVQNAMSANHKKNYVASAMTLSLNSTKTLEELEVLTLRHFSNFLHGSRSTIANMTDAKTPPLVFQGNQHVSIEGLSERAELCLLWGIQASQFTDNTQERVMTLINRVLSDTSRTSLDFYLRSQEMIWSLQSRSSSTRYATILELNLELTTKGINNVNQIIQATLDYLQFLQKGSHEADMARLFQEMRVHNLREYHFGSKRASLETTKDFAMRLQYITDVSDVVGSESWRDSTFNYKSVKEVLARLTSQDMIVFETLRKGVSLKGRGKSILTAPYTGAKYTVKPRDKGTRPPKAPGFRFVPENPYLAADVQTILGSEDSSNLTLRCPNNCGDVKAQLLTWRSRGDRAHGDIPKISGIHLGHSETGYNPFKSSIGVNFRSPTLQNSTHRTRALAWLWSMAITHSGFPAWSHFNDAGFQVQIEPFRGMYLGVQGFPRHIDHVMNVLISQMLETVISPTIFALAKQHLETLWGSYFGDGGIVQKSILNCTIFESADMSIDFLGTLKGLELSELRTFIDAFKKSAFAVVQLYGNIPLTTFQTVAAHLETMPFAPVLNNDADLYIQGYLSVRPDFYSPGEVCVRAKNLASTAYTTTVTNHYMMGVIGTDQQQADMFSSAMYFMNCQVFMNLRTRQQLGYALYARRIMYDGMKVPVMMFSISITATAKKWTTCELDQKIDEFLADYANQLRALQPDIYQTMIQMTCTPKTVTQANVADWFESKFGREFGTRDVRWKCARAAMKKVSVQLLSGNPDCKSKQCACALCASIGDRNWKRGSGPSSMLLYATGNGASRDYFVTPSNV